MTSKTVWQLGFQEELICRYPAVPEAEMASLERLLEVSCPSGAWHCGEGRFSSLCALPAASVKDSPSNRPSSQEPRETFALREKHSSLLSWGAKTGKLQLARQRARTNLALRTQSKPGSGGARL